jgi:hypothetical protein
LPASAVAADTNPYGTSTVDPAGPNEIIFTISKGSKSTQFATSRLFKLKTTEINNLRTLLKEASNFFGDTDLNLLQNGRHKRK